MPSSSAAEPAASTVATPDPPSPAVLTLPCVGPRPTWDVTQAQVDRWGELYPGVDVLGELRKALAWLEATPQRRKTARGAPAFLTRWLARASDRGPPGPHGGTRAGPGGGGPHGGPARDYRREAERERERQLEARYALHGLLEPSRNTGGGRGPGEPSEGSLASRESSGGHAVDLVSTTAGVLEVVG